MARCPSPNKALSMAEETRCDGWSKRPPVQRGSPILTRHVKTVPRRANGRKQEFRDHTSDRIPEGAHSTRRESAVLAGQDGFFAFSIILTMTAMTNRPNKIATVAQTKYRPVTTARLTAT